jgi:hypothetical protein
MIAIAELDEQSKEAASAVSTKLSWDGFGTRLRAKKTDSRRVGGSVQFPATASVKGSVH